MLSRNTRLYVSLYLTENQGCNKLFAKKDLQRHIAECEFGIAQWKSSEKYLKHKDEKVFYYQQ